MATSNFFPLKIWQLLCIFSKKTLCSILGTEFLFSEQTTQVQHLVDDQIPTQKRQFFLSVKRRNGYVACFEEDKRAAASSSSSFEETWVVETAAWLAFSTKFAFCQAPRERESHPPSSERRGCCCSAYPLPAELIAVRKIMWGGGVSRHATEVGRSIFNTFVKNVCMYVCMYL
jgi:hypothetical protein